MRNKKLKAFSLAELLIALLIISIVIAAAMPTITRKSSVSEKIWRWSNTGNNSTYFGVGQNQSVLIGSDTQPTVSNYFPGIEDGALKTAVLGRFSTNGDRVVLVKKWGGNATGEASSFINSHISFYNLENVNDATTNDITYAGRLAADQYNLALGIGTLQSIKDTELNGSFKGHNTAIGHYALFAESQGEYNVGVGELALAHNQNGKGNTALGYKSSEWTEGDYNTAIGQEALNRLSHSTSVTRTPYNGNTAIGAFAMNGVTEGTGNTAVGYSACSNLKGNYNTCIGATAGALSSLSDGNYKLYIGSDPKIDDSEVGGPALLAGKTHYEGASDSEGKYLSVNARRFVVAPHDGKNAVFNIDSKVGSSGYEDSSSNPVNANFRFNLYNNGANNRVAMDVYSANNYEINIDTHSGQGFLTPSTGIINANFSGEPKAIKLNGALNLKFTKNGTAVKDIEIQATNGNLRFVAGESSYLNIAAKNITLSNGELYLNNKNGNTVLKINEDALDDQMLFHSGGVLINKETWFEDIAGFKGAIKAEENIQVKGDIIANGGAWGNGGYASLKSTITNIFNRLSSLEGAYSDIRLKNVQGDNKAGLKEINALEVKDFTYKNDEKATPHVGVIAQQLQKIFPNAVSEDENGYLKIRTEDIFYAMVNSIKELFTKFQDLTDKITGLDRRIIELEKQNLELQKQNELLEKRLEKLEENLK